MAQVSAAFHCKICKQPLNFPNNLGITDFMIAILQFYNNHDLCEKTQNDPKLEKKPPQKKRK